jgi:hypothetical protein
VTIAVKTKVFASCETQIMIRTMVRACLDPQITAKTTVFASLGPQIIVKTMVFAYLEIQIAVKTTVLATQSMFLQKFMAKTGFFKFFIGWIQRKAYSILEQSFRD